MDQESDPSGEAHLLLPLASTRGARSKFSVCEANNAFSVTHGADNLLHSSSFHPKLFSICQWAEEGYRDRSRDHRFSKKFS